MTSAALPSASAAKHRPLHPLLRAGKWLASDLLSTFAFVGLYALFHSALVATVLSIAAGVAQIVYEKARARPVDAMQLMSLGLVVVFGAAALLTHDGRFIMFKPTLIYLAVGAVMLKPGWMTRYMPPIVLERSADLVVRFGFVWAGLMFLTAAVNAALALAGDQRDWALFIAVVPLGSKVVMVLIQYAVTRAVTVARIRRNFLQPA